METNKLLNSEESLPEVFYVFVNMNSLLTKHNLEFTKGFSSGAFGQLGIGDFAKKYLEGTVDYLPFIPNPDKDIQMVSAFYNNITSEYRTEYNCELHRKYNFPTYPSRLSAIYAFGDYDNCIEVSRKYHWDITTVKKFKLEPSPFNKVAKVNMEIVSLERYANRVSNLDQNAQNTIWQSYWTGFGEIQMELPTVNDRQLFNSGLIWEFLIEGRITLVEE